MAALLWWGTAYYVQLSRSGNLNCLERPGHWQKLEKGTVSAGELGAPGGNDMLSVSGSWSHGAPGLLWRDALIFLKQLQIETLGAKIEIGKMVFKIKESEALRAHVGGSSPTAGCCSEVSGLRE